MDKNLLGNHLYCSTDLEVLHGMIRCCPSPLWRSKILRSPPIMLTEATMPATLIIIMLSLSEHPYGRHSQDAICMPVRRSCAARRAVTHTTVKIGLRCSPAWFRTDITAGVGRMSWLSTTSCERPPQKIDVCLGRSPDIVP